MNQDTVLSVFNFRPWIGLAYRWTASTWSVGGAVVIEQGRESYQALLHPGITHAVLNPLVLADILTAPANAFPCNDTMQLAVGGGAVTRMQAEQAKARITPRLFNYVASTEAGVIAFTPLETPEDHRWHRLVPGRVVEIVDEFDRPLPTGKIGQLRISTAGGPTSYLCDEPATRDFLQGRLLLFRRSGRHAIRRAHGAARTRYRRHQCARSHKFLPTPIENRLGELFGCGGVCLFSMQNSSGEEEIHVVVETRDADRL